MQCCHVWVDSPRSVRVRRGYSANTSGDIIARLFREGVKSRMTDKYADRSYRKDSDIEAFAISEIAAGHRLRGVDRGQMRQLSESMKQIGLLNPITVWVEANGTPLDRKRVHLIAGVHRLEAAKALGWQKIETRVVQMDRINRQLWEIDENLCRAELSKAEKAQFLCWRAELIEERKNRIGELTNRLNEIEADLQNGEIAEAERVLKLEQRKKLIQERARVDATGWANLPTYREVRRRQGRRERSRGPAALIAEELGMEKRDVNRYLRWGKEIAPDVLKAVKDMPHGRKGIELDALCRMGGDEQREAVRLVRTGEIESFQSKPASKAKVVGLDMARRLTEPSIRNAGPAPIEAKGEGRQSRHDSDFLQLKGAWNQACPEARARFLDWMNLMPLYSDDRRLGAASGERLGS
jgi:ParB/RepB/Spo0J family partition protein